MTGPAKSARGPSSAPGIVSPCKITVKGAPSGRVLERRKTRSYSPGKPGAVLILDVPNPAAATSLVADLPLATAGLITTEIIPLHPLDL